MGMKERPTCEIEGCNNPALVVMLGKYICGECVTEWDKKQKEKIFKEMQKDLK